MTREEAIAILKAHHMWTGEPQEIIDVRKENKALEMAIKALEQEPCDDAISRIIKRMWNCRGKHTTSIDKVAMEQIIRDELPSVNPQKPSEDMPCITPEEMQKCKDIFKKYTPKGEWLDVDGIWFKCSECGAHRKMFPAYKEYYCPNCGARMESEDKE